MCGRFSTYLSEAISTPICDDLLTPTASDSEVTNYWWNHPERGRALFDLLLYSEVDMTINAGRGKVTKRMVPLLQGMKLSKTQMMACRHGDGKSWWLLKQASDTNMIYKFLFTENKVYGPYIQGFAEPHFTNRDVCGQAMFSKNGTKYATTIQGFRKVCLYDFDRCNGMLSNPKTVDVPTRLSGNPVDPTEGDSSTNGLCFSPNGRYLYVVGFYTVQQLDLQDNNPNTRWTQLAGIDTTWQEFQGYSNIYPGSDGKLYIGNWDGLGGQMSAINNPNAKGAAAGFCRKCLRFPGFMYQGVTRFFGVAGPPCMPDYHLGPASPICYPVGVEPPVTISTFKLYPNPTNGALNIEFTEAGTLEIADITGRRLKTISLLNTQSGKAIVILADLPAGVCICRYIVNGRLKSIDKITIIH